MTETTLEMATRHVIEGERHVAQQREIVEKLEQDGHADAAETARALLTEFEQTLAEHREHMALEQKNLGGQA